MSICGLFIISNLAPSSKLKKHERKSVFLLWYPSPKIKFKQFISFYNINPDRWDLNEDVVRCEINDCKYIALHFNFFDYYRYKKRRKKINKNSISIKNNEDLSKVIEMVKKDISKYKGE